MKITLASKSAGRQSASVHIEFRHQKNTEVLVSDSGKRSIIIGLEKGKAVTRRRFILLCREIIKTAKVYKADTINISWEDMDFPGLGLSGAERAELFATGAIMANFDFVKFKTKPKEGWGFVREVLVRGSFSEREKAAFRRGRAIGKEVNACRSLANTPGGEMTPSILAQEARRAARGTRVRIKILGPREMKKLKMGAVLGVAQGSDEEPRFIIAEYWGAGRKEKPIVLVGKGVTFDTGGLNLKPSDAIYEMHMDMSGGAAVLHAVILASTLRVKKNVVALIPAVENMPSGSSYHPGDVLKSMSGKTIEVLNTDAEGRVILADGLHYAKKYKPRLIIDVATLTGSALSALGQRASAIFATDARLEKLFCDMGEETGDYVWPLPLWEEYEEEIKGTFGDVANSGKVKAGGAIQGAVFLWQFVKGYSWVHVDIAPRMTTIDGEHLAKGAAGAAVRLLIKVIERA